MSAEPKNHADTPLMPKPPSRLMTNRCVQPGGSSRVARRFGMAGCQMHGGRSWMRWNEIPSLAEVDGTPFLRFEAGGPFGRVAVLRALELGVGKVEQPVLLRPAGIRLALGGAHARP